MTDLKTIAHELAEVLQMIRTGIAIANRNGKTITFGGTTLVRIDATLEQYNDYLKEKNVNTTKPAVYESLLPDEKTLYDVSENITSREWATKLSDFIDKLGGDSPALWQWSGITPTPENVVEFLQELFDFHMTIAADNELDACCEWLKDSLGMPESSRELVITRLRDARRPKPTLKEQALKDFETIKKNTDVLPEILETVEKALNSIPEVK